MKRKWIKNLFTYVVCVSLMATPLTTLGESTAGDYTIPSGTTELKLETLSGGTNRTIVIPNTMTNIKIVGDSSKTYTGLKIEVEGSRTNGVNVTIKNVKIDQGGIDIATTGESTLTIEGINSVTGTSGQAGVIVRKGEKLKITASDMGQKLTAVGGSQAAGIGSCYNDTDGSGKITIANGYIDAQGNDGGAGIGAGNQVKGTELEIEITGGKIKATSVGVSAAGIGGGYNTDDNSVGDIRIVGNPATPVIIEAAIGSGGGAGIGAGSKVVGDIIISGNVTILKAEGVGGGAGIGSGEAAGSQVGDIKITGGAHLKEIIGSTGGAGIGGGKQGKVGNITLTDVIIDKITGGSGAAGIGTGVIENIANITIDGTTRIKEVYGGSGTTSEAYGGAAIGGGIHRGIGSITITGDVVIEKAVGGPGTGAIGGGKLGTVTNIAVDSSSIYAEAGADISGKTTNDVGGSLDRETQDGVTIDGDLFVRNNQVATITVDETKYANYVFKCYKPDGTPVSAPGYNEDTNIVELGADFDFRIKDATGNRDYNLTPRTDDISSLYAWLDLETVDDDTLGRLDYFFEADITIDGVTKTYIARQKPGGISERLVTVGTKSCKEITIPIIFDQVVVKENLGPVGTPSNCFIRPYALSQAAFEVDLSNFNKPDIQIMGIEIEVDTQYDGTTDPTKCVAVKTVRDETDPAAIRNLTPTVDGMPINTIELKGTPTGGDPLNYVLTETPQKYTFRLYLADELNESHAITSGTYDMAAYKREYVDLGAKQQIEVKVKVDIKQQVRVSSTQTISYKYSVQQDQTVELEYKETPNIH